jgi:hypothetical protein
MTNHPRWKTADEIPGSISVPFGIKTSHTWYEVGQILRIINDLDIESFVEIGTHVGGLGSIVSCLSKYKTFTYIGVEKVSEFVDKDILDKILIADAMTEETAKILKDLTIGRTLWYCDGGNKVEEMKFYQDFMSKNDVIACHDYFGGQEVYGLHGFGKWEECPCKPEVLAADLEGFKDWKKLDEYFLIGTRIMGFVK